MCFDRLIRELVSIPVETPLVEFKHNNYNPEMMGKTISALANSATLHDKTKAYMLWGIDDVTHEIIGTDYDIQTMKKGNQEIGNWLRSLLSSNAEFDFRLVNIDGKNVGIFTIHQAVGQPVKFQRNAYIRIGSYTKDLKDYPSTEAQLWDKLRSIRFEEQYAWQDLELGEALSLLSYSSYFELQEKPIPHNFDGVAHYMLEDGILCKQDNGLYAISNMGAILFAKNLNNFQRIFRKALRVVQYSASNRETILRDNIDTKGYVDSFRNMIEYISALLPSNEPIEGAIRKKILAYPLIAIREAIANALIHQDFFVTGTGPVVEIFSNRIEITNPGKPLIDIQRIVDNPPKSRNEKLANLMRRLRMCEELGTGWDRIVLYCEAYQLPAPRISVYEDSTRVLFFSEKSFSDIAIEDKLWSCYLHACIKHVQEEYLTNTSLRQRFGLEISSSGSISRLIKTAVEKKLIKPFDPDTAPRYMKYVPIWA